LLLLFPGLLFVSASDRSGQIRSLGISPDGKVVAVDFGKGRSWFISTIAVETNNSTRLTDAKTGAESAPAFSPDGKRIAYSYWLGTGARSSIVIVNVDGSDLDSWSSEGSDYGPVFSPDIKIIIFARSGYYGDLKVSADGTTERRNDCRVPEMAFRLARNTKQKQALFARSAESQAHSHQGQRTGLTEPREQRRPLGGPSS
jgi:dipeptidyl aminopeptidase/acylaminoacyl peptidase